MTTRGHVEYLNPDELLKNPAFTQVVIVARPVRTVYIGGQNAASSEGQIVGTGDVGVQAEQVLRNLETALAAAGAEIAHVIKWNIHIVDGQPLQPAVEAFQRFWGRRPNPPLITLTRVSGLANPDFLVELDAVAVVPE